MTGATGTLQTSPVMIVADVVMPRSLRRENVTRAVNSARLDARVCPVAFLTDADHQPTAGDQR